MFNSGSLGSGNVLEEWLPLTQKEACIISTQAHWVELWLLSFIGYHLGNLRWFKEIKSRGKYEDWSHHRECVTNMF